MQFQPRFLAKLRATEVVDVFRIGEGWWQQALVVSIPEEISVGFAAIPRRSGQRAGIGDVDYVRVFACQDFEYRRGKRGQRRLVDCEIDDDVSLAQQALQLAGPKFVRVLARAAEIRRTAHDDRDFPSGYRVSDVRDELGCGGVKVVLRLNRPKESHETFEHHALADNAASPGTAGESENDPDDKWNGRQSGDGAPHSLSPSLEQMRRLRVAWIRMRHR